MTIIARPATPGHWVDFSVWPTDAQLDAFRVGGIIGCMVYGPLPRVSEAQKAHDLTPARLLDLTGRGFEVLLIQHCRYPGWYPGIHNGAEDADAIAEHATICGYPTDAHIGEDWEGIGTTCTAAIGAKFLDDFSERLTKGYSFGGLLYVGYQQPLSADQLYERPYFNQYASDEGHRRVSTRGVSFSQGPQVVLNGATVDTDTLAPDLLGDVPIVCAAA
jgi:hypothetical protein